MDFTPEISAFFWRFPIHSNWNTLIKPVWLYCKILPSHTGQEQACTRITWLFVRLFVCHHAENGPIHRKMVVDCPLVITSKVKLFFRPDKTRKMEWMVQPVFCIVDAGSCYFPFSGWQQGQNGSLNHFGHSYIFVFLFQNNNHGPISLLLTQ